MPALPNATPSARLERAIAVALAAVMLASALAIILPEPASATNWSGRIAATRGAQLTSEAVMLSADRQVRSLKHAIRKDRRKLRAQRRAIARVTQRRDEARARLVSTRERLGLARVGLQAATEAAAAAEIPEMRWRMDPAAVPTLRLPAVARESGPALLPDAPATWHGDGDPDEDRDLGLLVAPASTLVGLESRRAQVHGLERTTRQHERRLRVLQRKTRRLERRKRARIRAIGSSKAQRRAAISRRVGAEGALASYIVSMSHLAVRRAMKKTKVRPGWNTPFVWPARGRISQRYGCTGSIYSPRRGSCAHFHDGVDIVAGHGSPIRAAGVGVVSYVGRNPWDRGKRAFMVVIAHPGGYETLYGHVLPIRRVRVGQLVRKGEVIAYMGSTGHSTGTHLHLELRRGYTTLDPLAFL